MSFIPLLAVACMLAAANTAKGKNKELQIINEFVPEECTDIAEAGDEVSVHYTGSLDSGTVFDTSRQPSRGPLTFVLGQNKVIQGWEQGIKGMCVGEKRKLIIPPSLGYGHQGHPPIIPPEATLTFDTELISVKKKPSPDILFRLIRFLLVPAGVLCAVYYVYTRARKAPTKRELREATRRKKK
jgi:hypothetical protein